MYILGMGHTKNGEHFIAIHDIDTRQTATSTIAPQMSEMLTTGLGEPDVTLREDWGELSLYYLSDLSPVILGHFFGGKK